MTGFTTGNLHMIIHGFVFEEGTKPAYEHHLQVAPNAKPASHPLTGITPEIDFGAGIQRVKENIKSGR